MMVGRIGIADKVKKYRWCKSRFQVFIDMEASKTINGSVQ